MVKEKPKVEKDSRQVRLVPNFKVEPDLSLDDTAEVKISDSSMDVLLEACPHFKILKDRYAQYKNPDDFGNPDRIPCKISRRHQITPFIQVMAKADLSKGLTRQPTKLIKRFVYNEKTHEKEPFLLVNQIVVGKLQDGSDTPYTTVMVGTYEYPLQFKQDLDGEWAPVNNKFKREYYIPFTKENVDEYAMIGDHHVKKYVVENLDGTKSASLTYDQFVNLQDEEQIKLAETTAGQK